MPDAFRQPHVRLADVHGDTLLAAYPFLLQNSLQRVSADFGPMFPLLTWEKKITRSSTAVIPAEIRMCVLFSPGFCSSRLPTVKPAMMDASQIARKTSPKATATSPSFHDGHGLSPKTNNQRISDRRPEQQEREHRRNDQPGHAEEYGIEIPSFQFLGHP